MKKLFITPFYHLLIWVLISFLSIPSVQSSNLPDLGSSDLIEYNLKLEQQLGRAFISALHTQYSLNYDPETLSYIRKVGREIARQIGEPRTLRFYVINNESINAFAGPNGVIGIHTGLILATQNEDELAAVIAHEVAHITQNHLSRRQENNTQQGHIHTFATLLAAILIGMHDSSAVYPTLIAGMSLDIEQQLKNSRLHESEADHIGIQFLSQAGYDPHAMGSFFNRLAQNSQHAPSQIPEILRTHPVTEERMAESENRAVHLPSKSRNPSNNYFTLIQLRLHQSNSHPFPKTLSQAEQCYQNNLSPPLASTTALAHIQCLKTLVQTHPNHILYTALLLQNIVQWQLKEPKLIQFATQQADYLNSLYPTQTALTIRYSQLLRYLDHEYEAIQVLNTYTQYSPLYTYQVFKLLSEIHAEKQQTAEAYFFLAQAQFNIGNLKRTQYLLKQAQKLASPKLKQQITFFQHQNSKLLKDKQITIP